MIFLNKLLDGKSNASSKRFIGLCGAFTLIACLAFNPTNESLIMAVTTLTLGSLAITGYEKVNTQKSAELPTSGEGVAEDERPI